VDEAAEEVVAFRRPGAWWIGSIDRFGRLKAACSMWASAVVVSHVGAEHVFEMSAADDQQPVETRGVDGADKALGVGVCLWRTDRRMDHFDAFAAEDLVKGGAKLTVPVIETPHLDLVRAASPHLSVTAASALTRWTNWDPERSPTRSRMRPATHPSCSEDYCSPGVEQNARLCRNGGKAFRSARRS
jgi:hypothetical protein